MVQLYENPLWVNHSQPFAKPPPNGRGFRAARACTESTGAYAQIAFFVGQQYPGRIDVFIALEPAENTLRKLVASFSFFINRVNKKPSGLSSSF
ncbi:MAG: hypothetical protein ACK5Q1_12925 [Limnobacter sp.]